MNKTTRLYVMILAAAVAAAAVPARADELADEFNAAAAQAQASASAQAGLTGKALARQEKAQRKAEAAQEKEDSRLLLQDEIMNAPLLAHWGFTVPADQTIRTKPLLESYFPPIWLTNKLEHHAQRDVSFQVVYQGVREKISCEVDSYSIDCAKPGSAVNKELCSKVGMDTIPVVGVSQCEVPFGAKAWPKDLKPDFDAGGIVFSPEHGTLLRAYINLTDVAP